MKRWEGNVKKKNLSRNERVWELLQGGPVLLEVGEDFNDSGQMVRWQASVASGMIGRRAKSINKKVYTNLRPNKSGIIVWMEPNE